MKKYIKPEIDTLETVEDMYLDITATSAIEYDTNSVNLTKERESVNFSDEESIW